MTVATDRMRQVGEGLLLPLAALAASAAVFGLFVAAAGSNPLEVYYTIYQGAFGSAFSWQNTLVRAAPLMLTALCTALPARLGLLVIGGEGALAFGGLAAVLAATQLGDAPPLTVQIAMVLAAMLAGGAWILLAGGLRAWRGVNETISSLLLNYIAAGVLLHLVIGPMRDPASLNKPSTYPIGDVNMLGSLVGTEVHWGFVYGVIACIAAYLVFRYTSFGFAAAIVGGNVRAARSVGIPTTRLILVACFMGGAAAGLAGMTEVAAVHGKANDSLLSGYGYAGILVAFLARHNPLAIVPVAILIGGIGASGGLLQRRFDLPDATVLVLQGIVFLAILLSETYRGRLRPLMLKGAA